MLAKTQQHEVKYPDEFRAGHPEFTSHWLVRRATLLIDGRPDIREAPFLRQLLRDMTFMIGLAVFLGRPDALIRHESGQVMHSTLRLMPR